MNDETVSATEILDSVPTEPAPQETQSVPAETPETFPSSVESTEEAPDTTENDSLEIGLEQEEIIPETLELVLTVQEYTQITAESTSVLANVYLCGALMIVGVLVGIRLWRD